MENTADITIRHGTCRLLFAHDIGTSINLESSQARLLALGKTISIDKNRRAPKYFDFDPQPLTIRQQKSPLKIGPYETAPSITLTLYDFGAVSIGYDVPISGKLEDLRSLSIELNQNDLLLADSKKRVTDLIQILGKSIVHPSLAKPVEDYAVFIIDDFDFTCSAEVFPKRSPQILAQILRSENNNLSTQEIDDALAYCISYSHCDISIIDWNSAIIFDKEADDVRAVLEFANVELLEMRVLDSQLDDALEKSYEMTYNIPGLLRYYPGKSARILRHISRMQLEGAWLLERVSNAPKLIGDQFLARVYRLAAQRFHLREWNSGIQGKLDTIEDFYEQIHNGTVGLRMELLEWVIIFLIALEIVINLLPGEIH